MGQRVFEIAVGVERTSAQGFAQHEGHELSIRVGDLSREGGISAGDRPVRRVLNVEHPLGENIAWLLPRRSDKLLR